MVDNREDEPAEDVEPPKSGKMKLIILGVLGALLLVAATIGGTVLVLRSDVASGADPDPDAEAEAEAVVEPAVQRTPYYVELLDSRFAVNLASGSRAKFLKISMEALTFDPDVDTALRDHMPQIRSDLMLILSSQRSQELDDRSGREALAKRALGKIRKTLAAVGVKGKVESLFFTSFVMQ